MSPSAPLLYFSYGANLSQTTLKKRGVQLSSPGVPARVSDPHIALAFAHRGGFATLIDANKGLGWGVFRAPPLESGRIYTRPHGVLYSLEAEQLEAIALKELGYRQMVMKVETQGCDEPTEASVFVSSPWQLLRRPVLPSKRYRNLIIEGAKLAGLASDYIVWLEAMPAVEAAALAGSEYSATPAAAATKLLGIAGLTAAAAAFSPPH